MNNKRVYNFVIIGLVVLNIILLAFLLIKPPQPIERSSPKNFRSEIVKTLRLNDLQESRFHDLADEHKQKMADIDEEKVKLLYPYFESLSDTSLVINKDSILNQLQQYERKKIELTYLHFKEIKELLTKEQLVDFDAFMSKVVNRLSGSRK
ncbi:hypothetical protein [uncultured Aquimarina sp.]|uniref:hypothetical protein n=1 Tax=uncultured Aquimarina sp. TaxID=575652 RepID=UPI0026331082|nr:hypothetical protein [uncultured Aquimarina sp.]